GAAHEERQRVALVPRRAARRDAAERMICCTLRVDLLVEVSKPAGGGQVRQTHPYADSAPLLAEAHAALPDRDDVSRGQNVARWIRLYQQEIGAQAWTDSSAVGEAERAGRRRCRRRE